VSELFSKLRKAIYTTPEEREIEVMNRELDRMAVRDWIESIIESTANEIIREENAPEFDHPVLLPSALESWRRLNEFEKEWAFIFLLGAIRGLMRPPDDFVGAKV